MTEINFHRRIKVIRNTLTRLYKHGKTIIQSKQRLVCIIVSCDFKFCHFTFTVKNKHVN